MLFRRNWHGGICLGEFLHEICGLLLEIICFLIIILVYTGSNTNTIALISTFERKLI